MIKLIKVKNVKLKKIKNNQKIQLKHNLISNKILIKMENNISKDNKYNNKIYKMRTIVLKMTINEN